MTMYVKLIEDYNQLSCIILIYQQYFGIICHIFNTINLTKLEEYQTENVILFSKPDVPCCNE